MTTRHSIRKQILQKRTSLNKDDINAASKNSAKLLIESDLYQQSQHIGFYIASNGEIDPHPVLSAALADGKFCYLPILDPIGDNQLIFANYSPGDSLLMNRFQILEPMMTPSNVVGPKALDLVLVPLVAFDEDGVRLGMGKGYYDRTFAYKNTTKEKQKPVLIGYAYEFQKATGLSSKEWDVSMDFVVTDALLYECAWNNK